MSATHSSTETSPPAQASARPEIATLQISDLTVSLRQGARDFLRAPLFGLFFSSFYTICGLGLTAVGADVFTWTLVLALGFPLVAPFAAVGLYEVSRRLEAEIPLLWSEVLFVVWRERGRQIPWMGAILVIIFLFWSFFAHMSLALFLGKMTLVNVMSSSQLWETFNGMTLIAFEIATGGVVALVTFALTVVSLPLLLDREIDFVSAMLISFKTMRSNSVVLLVWAAFVGGCVLLAMLPWFVGLLVALPITGHATWHLYRRALVFPD